MKASFKTFQIFVFVTLSLASVSFGDVIGKFQSCGHFYSENSNRTSVRSARPTRFLPFYEVVRTEPKAIGDSFEKPYQPAKGKSVELKEPEVSNQCSTYECYLFSVINFINVYNKNKRSENAPTISSEYLVANKFLEHIKEGIVKGVEDPQLVHDLEGGFPFEAVHLTRMVGLITQKAWTGPKLKDWDTATIYKTLKKEVPLAHAEIKKLAEEKGSWDHPDVKIKIEAKIAELSQVVYKVTGEIPKTFEHEGENFDPKSFERKYGLPRLSLFTVHDRGIYDLPDNIRPVLRQAVKDEGGNYKIVSATEQNLLLSIKDYIDQGLPVILDLTWRNDGHSMLVVGYEVNDAGEIIRFKVMNSWGPTYGNKGYAWYTPEDVWKNVTGTYRFNLEKQ